MKAKKKLLEKTITAIGRMLAAGDGDDKIARTLKVTRHDVRKVKMERAETALASQMSLALVPAGGALSFYDTARQALAQAKNLGDVKDVADRATALKEYARRASDRILEIDAAELRIRAERRLGEMLAATPLSVGGRPRKDKAPLLSELATLREIGVDHKLSSRAQKLAALPAHLVEARIAAWRVGAERGAERVSVDLLRGAPINGARSVMGSRAEPDDSLDFFPTPPWATRALMEQVLPECLLKWSTGILIWEPAAGEGHMSEVLREYQEQVIATDVFDYRGGGVTCDFLSDTTSIVADWIVTNPPFSGSTDRALEFTLRALDLARDGVAMFVRSQWAVEGVERYETLFRDRPPTLCAFFTERVNLCKGRWDPKGGTATAYCWLVWIKGRDPMPPLWIPPGCRQELTRPDDVRRFAAWSLPEEERQLDLIDDAVAAE